MDLSNTLSQHQLTKFIETWLAEDIPNFDYGGFVVGNLKSTTVLICKSNGEYYS